jgi:hypothetical protein
MFYSGSVSPPREPARKKIIIPRRSPVAEEMGDTGTSDGARERVRESSLMWPMLTRSNYVEWAMLLQCNFETLEICDTIDPGGEGVKRSRDRQAMAGILRPYRRRCGSCSA